MNIQTIVNDMLKPVFMIVIFTLVACSQKPENMMKVLSRIKSVPDWYSKVNAFDGKKRESKSLDSTYNVIVRMDTNAIVRLMFILSDTSKTDILNPCNGGYLTYGQLAFFLINDIEPVPYSFVTKQQWDALGECRTLPDGFLNYIKVNAKKFENDYWIYFNSKERQNIIQAIGITKTNRRP